MLAINCVTNITHNTSKFKQEMGIEYIFVNYAHFYVNAVMLTMETNPMGTDHTPMDNQRCWGCDISAILYLAL